MSPKGSSRVIDEQRPDPVTPTVSAAGPAYTYSGAPRPDDRGTRHLLRIASILAILFVVVAIAKPWGSPEPLGGRPTAAAIAGPPSPLTTPEVAMVGPGVAEPNPTIVAFTTPAPPPVASPWVGLRWSVLAPDDPVRLVTRVIRWSGGFVAIGQEQPGSGMTPIWTSSDGRGWDPIPFGTSATFWPGTSVVGMTSVTGGLVALTEMRTDCGNQSCAPAVGPATVAWASTDGRTWRPSVLPAALPANRPLVLAGGSGGLVVTATDPGSSLLLSDEGVAWTRSAAGAIPTDVIVNDLRRTAEGYVGAGLRVRGGSQWQAVLLWSPDGRQWTVTPAPGAVASGTGAGDVETAATSIRAGSTGVLVLGRDLVWPGSALWWQSSDGRHWSALRGFAPLGSVACGASICGNEPDGWLLGDGSRLVAVRGGPAAGAWTSADGRSWHPLAMTGEVPAESAVATALLPGGVVMTNGSSAWLGVPIVR